MKTFVIRLNVIVDAEDFDDADELRERLEQDVNELHYVEGVVGEEPEEQS